MSPVSNTTIQSVTPMDPDANMQEVLPKLWIGDYAAASDIAGLRAHGIEYVVSALRFKPRVVQGITFHNVPVDDTADADILAHLPACIAFIDKAIESGAGVLVHCHAGVSRSATIVAAYLMSKQKIESAAALTLVRKVRPQADPSENFLRQLDLFYEVSFKVSKNAKPVRRFYLERTVEEVMNGDGSLPAANMLASWPDTPASSSPSTPSTERPKRRIRCKKCRRELATREHMLDHGVGLPTRPGTPRLPEGDSPKSSLNPSRSGSRRNSSTIPEALAPKLAQLSTMTVEDHPGGPTVARRSSVSISSPLSQEFSADAQPAKPSPSSLLTAQSVSEDDGQPAKSNLASGQTLSGTLSDPALSGVSQLTNNKPDQPLLDSAISEDDGPPLMTASALSAHLPPVLAALRQPRRASANGLQPMSKLSTAVMEEKVPVARASPTYFSPPILANQSCSGYFLEPMKWMEPFLESGEMAGKIVCPNKKCNAKLGNYDWAGVRCSCKEWITPGFCVHKSKVDEDL